MNTTRRTATLVLAAALLSCTSCIPGRWLNGDDGAPASTVMSGPEAQQTLTRARELTYAGTKTGAARAVELASSIIQHCGERQYIWQAFFVKAVAFAGQENHANAKATAAEGIRAILTLCPNPLDDHAFRALKMLLPVYIESCALAGAHKEGSAALEKWRPAVLSRYPRDAADDQDPTLGIRQEFKLLQEMIEQYAASREPESRIKLLVLTYLRLHNTSDRHGLAALFGEQKGWTPETKRIFASMRQPDAAAKHLYLVSAVKLSVPKETTAEPSLSGEAVCDIMATSSAGRAKLAADVRFFLVRDKNGAWRISDISGHP